jgi:hypothetical protein
VLLARVQHLVLLSLTDGTEFLRHGRVNLMVEFHDLVNSLAQWRNANGKGASAPIAAPLAAPIAQPAIAASPSARMTAVTPPTPRSKAPSLPPPPPHQVEDFADVPDDAIEEDGADFAMAFGSQAPIQTDPGVFNPPTDQGGQLRKEHEDAFGDGESTMVGGVDGGYRH